MILGLMQMLNYLLSHSQREELHNNAVEVISQKRNLMEKEGKKCIEFHTTKRDGREIHLIMDYEAFKKLPKYKLEMIQDLF